MARLTRFGFVDDKSSEENALIPILLDVLAKSGIDSGRIIHTELGGTKAIGVKEFKQEEREKSLKILKEMEIHDSQKKQEPGYDFLRESIRGLFG